MGEKFGLDGIWIDGTSFILVSNFEGYNMHSDLDGLGTKVFNIIFPLVIPESGPSQLLVGDREATMEVPVNFVHDVGVLVGGDSKHGTGNCDYRETGEFRLAIALYFEDINEENVDEFASDTTAYFPPNGHEGYYLAQAGRHWGRGHSLDNDKGRAAYKFEDNADYDCESAAAKGQCDADMELRNACVKSCKVILDDESYFETLRSLLDKAIDEL